MGQWSQIFLSWHQLVAGPSWLAQNPLDCPSSTQLWSDSERYDPCTFEAGQGIGGAPHFFFNLNK
jgi:hypothetical protein